MTTYTRVSAHHTPESNDCLREKIPTTRPVAELVRALSAKTRIRRHFHEAQIDEFHGQMRIKHRRVELLRESTGIRWVLNVGTFCVDVDLIVVPAGDGPRAKAVDIKAEHLPFGVWTDKSPSGAGKSSGKEQLRRVMLHTVQNLLY